MIFTIAEVGAPIGIDEVLDASAVRLEGAGTDIGVW
jgi:hypothetical protein